MERKKVLKICKEAGKKGITANFRDANLYKADLYLTDLSYADFSWANLTGADLYEANLSSANFFNANLYNANLHNANLSNANLDGVNLDGANLHGANLNGAKNIPAIVVSRLMVCPEDGEFIGHKTTNGCYIKLRIPASAKRSNATTRNCRCSKAFVIKIINIKTGEEVYEIASYYEKGITYKKGEYVYPDSFDNNRWEEYGGGIHFVMTKIEALGY